MNPTKKFWYDENSEPPKNYIWVKNDKQYEFSVSERRWKEISSSEESGSSSKEITIDDVVKFIHDNNNELSFPFTQWSDIPIIPTTIDSNFNGGIYRIYDNVLLPPDLNNSNFLITNILNTDIYKIVRISKKATPEIG